MDIQVAVADGAAGHVARVRVEQGGRTTEHRVEVTREDLERYGGADVADLVRRSFEFLLEREPNTSILHEFRLRDIERYFPEYREWSLGP